ncbi:hypothetical protein E3P99_01926 [Wallemia hederae]|uniref:DUF7721 domain-containing protein n=1 Tax=Wallemia hederae TaxID=1540922 RepID=A0A4T0FNL1_9BASI|nr:hypothetical protein E3P99_01926 [Wallemia hederae]
MDLLKQGLEAYQNSGSNNSAENKENAHHGIDFESVIAMAKSEGGDHGSSQHSFMEKAVGLLNNNKHELEGDINEEESVQAHDKVFGGGDKDSASPKEHGIAYAMSLYKKHFEGGSNQTNESDSDLLGKVIHEATKLADEHLGGKSDDDKQSAVDAAALQFGKLIVKSKLSGGGLGGLIGGGNSGGLSSLASKFL